MVLLGDVRELEVEGERAEHARLAREGQLGDGIAKIAVGLARTRSPRECADALDVLEQLLAVLLDEDAPEQVAEEAHVAPQDVRDHRHDVQYGPKTAGNRTISARRGSRAALA
jgi:hypothetical protein